MYAKDLINKDNKKVKYYFAKRGRQISLSVYEDYFLILQEFGTGKVIKYNISLLDKFLKRLKKETLLLETVKYGKEKSCKI